MTDLEKLRAVLEAATPGPWKQIGDGGWLYVPGFVDYDGELSPEDARAIAALGSLWPALLAVAEAARGFHVDGFHRGADEREDPDIVYLSLQLDALDTAIREHLPEPSNDDPPGTDYRADQPTKPQISNRSE